MNIIIGLFILCNWKKYLQENFFQNDSARGSKVLKKTPPLQQNNTSTDKVLLEKQEYHWGDDDHEEINDSENSSFLDNKNKKKGCSIDVKSNIYLFIDI